MKNEAVAAVEMTRKIRDAMYEQTKGLSDSELIQYFRARAAPARESIEPKGSGEKRSDTLRSI